MKDPYGDPSWIVTRTTNKVKLWNGPCGDPYCYRGASGSGFAGGAGRFKDGPCNAVACEWPLDYKGPPQPQPASPIEDKGKLALDWLRKKTPGDPI